MTREQLKAAHRVYAFAVERTALDSMRARLYLVTTPEVRQMFIQLENELRRLQEKAYTEAYPEGPPTGVTVL